MSSVETLSIKDKNQLFPVFLKIERLNILIVGGGKVGAEKLNALLQNCDTCKITVVSEFFTQQTESLINTHENVKGIQKVFDTGDLLNAHLVIVAVSNQLQSTSIAEEARNYGLLVNVADQPELCDFYLGSIVQKGQLKIAISTNGKSPTVSKRLKEILNQSIPEHINISLDNIHKIRHHLNGNFEDKVRQLNKITSVLVEEEEARKERRWRKIASYSVIAFALMLIGHFIFSYIPLDVVGHSLAEFYHSLDQNFGIMLLAGFLAQLIDGALGMGYGVTSATVLLSAGVPPAAISGSIHTAEMFASGASGYSHYKFGNVNKKLFKVLVIPGVIGAIAGAILLVKLGEKHVDYIRPLLACYTLFLGIKILWGVFYKRTFQKKFKNYKTLAGVGGFLDSFGGGGWGPIVTTTLINKGRHPRYVIGSVSLTEFFVTLASAVTFFIFLGVQHWQTITGLIVGGLIAAPIAAKLVGKLPKKTAMILLGILVIFWSIRILVKLF
jgi:siroheme synthase-like protein